MLKEIAADFYMITLPMPFRLKHVNVYALVQDGRVALFDTGLNTPETFTVFETALARIGRSVTDIDRIFITHRHGDHCGMAGRLKALSGAAILMSAREHPFAAMSDLEERLIPVMQAFYLSHGLGSETISTLGAIFKSFHKMIGLFPLDQALQPGDRHVAGGRTFEVLSAPGHSRDQICFFFRKEGILLAGDHILPDITPNLSPDLFDPGFRPLQGFLASLNEMKTLPVTTVCPAHGRPFMNFQERILEIVDHHHERKELTLRAVRERRKTACEVSIDLFGKDLPEFDQFLALNETYVHLVELVHEGLIEEEIQEGRFFYR